MSGTCTTIRADKVTEVETEILIYKCSDKLRTSLLNNQNTAFIISIRYTYMLNAHGQYCFIFCYEFARSRSLCSQFTRVFIICSWTT